MSTVGTAYSGQSGFPRELVLASAGTGKTYTLSGRIIALLAAGAPPDTLLASTFTRKAAGEILNRVLARLALGSLSHEGAAELALATRTPGIRPDPKPEPEFFQGILRTLIHALHRVNVGTLDSFFIRVARGFSPDLGLPPSWTIGDEPGAQRLEAEALQRILAESSRQEMVELVRMAMRGDWGRGVHSRLLDQLRSLRELLHQAEKPGSGLWGPSRTNAPPSTREEREAVASLLSQASVPTNQAGKPNGHFVAAVNLARQELLAGDWMGFCKKGVAQRLLQGEETFQRKEIPGALREAVQAGLALAIRDLTREMADQARALEALTLSFDRTLSALQCTRGTFRFHDITFLLGGPDPTGAREDVWYRLDQQAHHLLLDEFQDTALEQWEALRPLAHELLSGHLEDRSATVVADPKQSIYGWRGADPLLVRRVGAAFSFQERTLERSYRSSPVVLELVNRVFEKIPENPVWGDSKERRIQAGIWAQSFPLHRPAREFPGYVRIQAGPADEDLSRAQRPRMMAWAAKQVRQLAQEAPGGTIGVLVRRNSAVSQLIMELRNLGVEASEEGATTLEDSAAVATFLALLKLSDHPGDTICAYQVQHSPLAALYPRNGETLSDWAERTAARVRQSLLGEGYGSVLTSWVREMGKAGQLDRRDLQRLLQLTELGFRWDRRATLRPGDFVRYVQAERMEAPSAARVRVMTIHQAKGLEFDQVVLPELDVPLTQGRGRHGGVFPLRNPETGRVVRILPRLPSELHPLMPELEEAARQDAASELRDALGVLYVALTRGRYALHLFLAERPGTGPDKLPHTFSGLLLGGLGFSGQDLKSGQVLLELGKQSWAADAGLQGELESAPEGEEKGEGVTEGVTKGEILPGPILLPKPVRRRNLHHRTPSSLAREGRTDLGDLLSLDREGSLQIGSIVHRWLQDLIWWEDWGPEEGSLLAQARAVAPEMDTEQIRHLLLTLKEWLKPPEIRARLSRSSYPAESRVETEYPFALFLKGEFFSGQIDRLVLVGRGQALEEAEVLDFKTDRLHPEDETSLSRKVQEYTPQILLYQEALSRMFKLPKDRVRATLIFLAPGRVVEVPTNGTPGRI